MTLLIYSAFIAGLAYCAAPGVINAEGIRRGLHHGFRPSFIFQMGSMATDTLWAIITLSGLAIIRPSDEMQIVLGTAGGLVLLWMAIDIFRKELRAGTAAAVPGGKHDLTLGALLSFANPFAPLFWLSIGGQLLGTEPATPFMSAAAIVATFVVVQVLWSVVVAGASSYGRAFVGASALRWINAGAGVMMAFLGLSICWQNVMAMAPFLA